MNENTGFSRQDLRNSFLSGLLGLALAVGALFVVDPIYQISGKLVLNVLEIDDITDVDDLDDPAGGNVEALPQKTESYRRLQDKIFRDRMGPWRSRSKWEVSLRGTDEDKITEEMQAFLDVWDAETTEMLLEFYASQLKTYELVQSNAYDKALAVVGTSGQTVVMSSRSISRLTDLNTQIDWVSGRKESSVEVMISLPEKVSLQSIPMLFLGFFLGALIGFFGARFWVIVRALK